MRTTRLDINRLTTPSESLLDKQLPARWGRVGLHCSLEWADPWCCWFGGFLFFVLSLRILCLFMSTFFLLNLWTSAYPRLNNLTSAVLPFLSHRLRAFSQLSHNLAVCLGVYTKVMQLNWIGIGLGSQAAQPKEESDKGQRTPRIFAHLIRNSLSMTHKH